MDLILDQNSKRILKISLTPASTGRPAYWRELLIRLEWLVAGYAWLLGAKFI
jgi:hypothetical protein